MMGACESPEAPCSAGGGLVPRSPVGPSLARLVSSQGITISSFKLVVPVAPVVVEPARVPHSSAATGPATPRNTSAARFAARTPNGLNCQHPFPRGDESRHDHALGCRLRVSVRQPSTRHFRLRVRSSSLLMLLVARVTQPRRLLQPNMDGGAAPLEQRQRCSGNEPEAGLLAGGWGRSRTSAGRLTCVEHGVVEEMFSSEVKSPVGIEVAADVEGA